MAIRPRKPGPIRSSPYITQEGFAALELESARLWKRRSEVTRALAAAAAEGDRSENAEYIYRKKELREIDRRIRYLQRRMPDLKVVREAPSERERVFFGAWVTLEDEDGRELRYRLVGPDEIDSEKGYISMDSPLAQALLRKRVDEEVLVSTPGGERRYWVLDVEYGSPP